MKTFNTNTANCDTWLTPPALINALGEFDLDPCCPEKMPWSTAKKMLSREQNGDGLTAEWSGERLVQSSIRTGGVQVACEARKAWARDRTYLCSNRDKRLSATRPRQSTLRILSCRKNSFPPRRRHTSRHRQCSELFSELFSRRHRGDF